MRQIRYTILLSCLLLTGAGAGAQVVGGDPKLGEADFYCALADAAGTSITPLCGASLIHPQWVLTAAHCVDHGQGAMDSVDVIMHPYTLHGAPSDYTRIRSEGIYVHPLRQQATPYHYDIALIKLRHPVKDPVMLRLPKQGDHAAGAPGTKAMVVGLGIKDTGQFLIMADTLRWAEIDIISNDICNEADRYNGQLMAGNICAGSLTGSHKGSARGDSGGPLYIRSGAQPVQIGVVSGGLHYYSTRQHPGIYTRVSEFRGWIDSVIGANTAPLSAQQIADAPAEISVSARSGMLRISSEKQLPGDMLFSIIDLTGRTVFSGTIPKGVTRYSAGLPDAMPGLYLFRYSDHSRRHSVKKIFINN